MEIVKKICENIISKKNLEIEKCIELKKLLMNIKKS